MNKQLTVGELFYLAEYANEASIFGLDHQASGIEERNGLIQKGILGARGEIRQETVGYVEALKKYNQSLQYVHISQLIFGIQKDGLCLLLRQAGTKETPLYQLYFCEIVELLRITLQHPIMKLAGQDIFQQLYPDEEIPKALKPNPYLKSQLIIELFDQDQVFTERLLIGYDNGTYYEIDEETYQNTAEAKKVNSFQ